MIRTQLEFTLPKGYVDPEGNVHRQGVMRLATALDETEPLGDPRARANEAYVGILLLSRVLLRLGSISPVSTEVVEGMFSSDYAYLQELYVRLNTGGLTELPPELIETECPSCKARFVLDLKPLASAAVEVANAEIVH